MIISYIFQLKDFCILLLIGFIMGIIYGILYIPYIISNKLIIKNIVDLLYIPIICLTFIISTNYINMGQFRLFLLLAYLIGIVLESLTLGKLFAKGYKSVYNKLVNFHKMFRNSKLGKVIFK